MKPLKTTTLDANEAVARVAHKVNEVLDVTMATSLLLKKGIDEINVLLRDMANWMEMKRYESARQMKGAMSSACVTEPAAVERANYLRILQSYKSHQTV